MSPGEGGEREGKHHPTVPAGGQPALGHPASSETDIGPYILDGRQMAQKKARTPKRLGAPRVAVPGAPGAGDEEGGQQGAGRSQAGPGSSSSHWKHNDLGRDFSLSFAIP